MREPELALAKATLIRSLRSALDLTRYAFAVRLDTNEATIHNWELGFDLPSVHRLEQIVTTLGFEAPDVPNTIDVLATKFAAIARHQELNIHWSPKDPTPNPTKH